MEYLEENLSNSYEVAESIEIVNTNKTQLEVKDYESPNKTNSMNHSKDVINMSSTNCEEINTSSSDWTETYKEYFESKNLITKHYDFLVTL